MKAKGEGEGKAASNQSDCSSGRVDQYSETRKNVPQKNTNITVFFLIVRELLI